MKGRVMTSKYATLAKQLQAVYAQGQFSNESFHEIEKIVREEGLTSEHAVAQFLVSTIQHMHEHSADFQAVILKRRTELRHDPEHGAPPPKKRALSSPFIYNGHLRDASEFRQLADKHLHTFVSTIDKSQTLTVFDSVYEVDEYARSHSILASIRAHSGAENTNPAEPLKPKDVQYGFSRTLREGEVSPYPSCSGAEQLGFLPTSEAVFYEHVNYEGECLKLDNYRALSNLVDCTKNSFFFFETSNWNDAISSIKVGNGTVIAYEHINFLGSSIRTYGSVPVVEKYGATFICNSAVDSTREEIVTYVQPIRWTRPIAQDLNNLVSLGWNDRISSIQHGSFF
jgi:Beta/Gamma crystallin